MKYIYILTCQKDKYYIGKTDDVQKEYNQHLDGTICEFTNIYKPFDIECIFVKDDNFDLYRVIAKYTHRYNYINIGHDEVSDQNKLNKYISKANSKCCCGDNHFLTHCPFNKRGEFWGKVIHQAFSHITEYFTENSVCFRCGRFGHDFTECNAKEHLDGTKLKNDTKIKDDTHFKD
jgi:hypothetical protein